MFVHKLWFDNGHYKTKYIVFVIHIKLKNKSLNFHP